MTIKNIIKLNKPIPRLKQMGQCMKTMLKRNQNQKTHIWNNNAQFHRKPNKHKLKLYNILINQRTDKKIEKTMWLARVKRNGHLKKLLALL